MQRIMLKSKIHRAKITETQIDYEGSITVDADLLKMSDILPGEQVHVLNLNNGNRLVTYTIPATKGSGAIILNGPAARLGEIGDLIIIISYAHYNTTQSKKLKAKVITVDKHNMPRNK